jgi:ABC-type phosphate transport system substrate-binding protein
MGTVSKKRSKRSGHCRRALVIAVASLAVGVVCLPSAAFADTSPTTTSGTSGTGSVSTATSASSSEAPASSSEAPASTTTTTSDPSTSTTTAGDAGERGSAIAAHAGAGLNGAGSSFAAPAIETFQQVVQSAPYNLNVNYTSTSSGDGRYEFTNGTTDFAVSDIAYGLGNSDTTPPSFPYIYVPITAGGIAFMYNIPGLTKNLQLTSYTACAILTGGITNWNNSQIAASNPGVTLPNLAIRPVTESDPAGTNYVLEEWCIAEQEALWTAFANYINSLSSNQVTISATSPESQWPPLSNGLNADSTAAVASDVSTNAGAIGPVQLQYATDAGFGTGDTTKGVAAVENASGDYALPTPVDVASALAYATQLPNGTHQLNFGGAGAHVYNPSTYSYLLTPAKGWQAAKGAVLSAFVNYVLTLGQEKSPSIGYASLGLSLERYGIDSVTADVPGAVAVTSAENAAYACGDLTPSEVAAGQTTPTCGVTDPSAPLPPASGVAGINSHTASATTAGTAGSGGGSNGSGGSNGGGGAGGAGVSAAVSLGGSNPLAFTGSNPIPLVLVGSTLFLFGWTARRRLLRKRRARESL